MTYLGSRIYVRALSALLYRMSTWGLQHRRHMLG